MYDCVVVGAGPVGSNTARLLAADGHRVLLLEEHPEVGIPVQCAGLITPRVFEHTPFPIGELWQNDLHGAIVRSPDGTMVRFETDLVQAQAMDRAAFDQKMAAAAVEAGAELLVATKAVAARRDDAGVTVTLQDASGRRDVRCCFLVGADGIRGSVARWFRFPAVDETVSAYEVELDGATLPEGPRIIPMFAGQAQAPGFFSWIIPVGPVDEQGRGRVRAGLAVAPGMTEAAAKRYYERMFTDPQSAPYLQGTSEVYRIIGGIPLGLRDRLVQDRVALVGDAAGMAKPTSGGGIYMGLVASEHLVRVVSPRLATDRLSRGDLVGYERRVRRSIARELRKGTLLRRVHKGLRDADLNELARLCSRPKVRQVIERAGDIDYPSRLVVPLLLAEPRFVGLFVRAWRQGGT